MTTYIVKLRNDTAYAFEHIEADTPEQALDIAKKLTCAILIIRTMRSVVINHEIDVFDDEGDCLTSWQADRPSLELAAPDLLDALVDLVERDRAEAADCGFHRR